MLERPSQIERLKSELQLKDLGKLDPEQVAVLAKREFAVYFENPRMLDEAVSLGTVLFDYAFYHNYFKDNLFSLFLYRVLDVYHQAKRLNPTTCFHFFGLCQPSISGAHHNVACMAHLERPKSVDRMDLLTKTILQESGDLIEGTLAPHIKLILGMQRIAHGELSAKALVDQMESVSLGDAVAQMFSVHEDFKILYRDLFCGVPLNQWRNIAFHASYMVTGDQVECRYGNDNSLVVNLDRSRLTQVGIGIHHVGYMHKMAHIIFLCDNRDDISPFLPHHEMKDDTIVIQIVESCFGHGCEVLSCNKVDDIWEVTVRDLLGRNMSNIRSLLSDMLCLLSGISPGGMRMNLVASDGGTVILTTSSCRY